MLFCGVLFSATVNANEENICSEAALKINSIIVEWNELVIDYSAQEKNRSVSLMFDEHKAGTLEKTFIKRRKEKWESNQDIFGCFAGVRSGMGPAMCLHPDTNKNQWKYD